MLPRPPQLLPGRPAAVVDLQADEGAALVGAEWRYSDARVEEIDFVEVGSDADPLGPGDRPNRTFDVLPRAGAAEFDDSGWRLLTPAQTQLRLANGRVCFNWYRLSVTVPERVGDVDPAGCTIVFEVVVDDYAEVWVDGALPAALGDAGGPVVAGFNAPNRVVLTNAARAGQTFSIAVFGMNGPISASPRNYIWLRSATLDFFTPEQAASADPAPYDVTRVDAGLDAIVTPGTAMERVAGGFEFTEGPVWTADGALLFSSPKTICQHGNRRVVRVEPHGNVTVLADRYDGRRLNSPNDLVYRSDGTLYFTDPPFGLPEVFDDPKKELPFSGVFRVRDGEVSLVTDSLAGPNGLAFSPDERHLYIGDWDPQHKVVMRYDVAADGSVSGGVEFFDMTGASGEDAIDGIKVDVLGNLYVCGPSGIWIITADGTHLGTLHLPEDPHNLAWGDDDARSLYVTAMTSVYRLRLNVAGIRPRQKGNQP